MGYVSIVQLVIFLFIISLYPYSKSFNYQLTTKRQVVDIHAIERLYITNEDSTQLGIDQLLNNVNEIAYCYPVTHGGMSWGSSDVSPMCNCIQNIHTLYAADFLNIDVETKAATDLRVVTLELLKKSCHSGIRPTQYETLLPVDSIYTVNIVYGALMWNIMSCIVSFRYMWTSKSILYGVITLSVLPMYVAAIISGFESSIILPFVLTNLFALYSCGGVFTNYFRSSRKVTFWVQYAINLASLVVSHNVLQQRRDADTNLLFGVIGFSIGVLQLVSKIDPNDNVKDYIWCCTLFLTASLFWVSTAMPMVSTFSNTANASFYTLALLLATVVSRPNRTLASEQVSTSEPDYDHPKDNLIVDMLAKTANIIFTIAVLCDIVNLGL
jgi:hypothetical protein